MLFIAAALMAADVSGLSLEATTPQRELLVGEPLRLTLRWKAARAVKHVAIEEPDFVFQSLLLSVNDGSGSRLYREYPHDIVERLLVTRSLGKDEEDVANLVFYRGGYLDRPGGEAQDGFLFPRKGEYSVTAIYAPEGTLSTVVSRAVRVKVMAPSGSDRAILDLVAKDPMLLRGGGDRESQALVKELLSKHPDTRYLRWAKLRLFEERANALLDDRDPDTRESIFHLGAEGLADFRHKYYRRLAEDVLSEQGWGAFEEEALALASLYAHGAGDKEMSERVKKDLFEKHPRSATVKRIKEVEAEPSDIEDDPPTVKPSPKPKQ